MWAEREMEDGRSLTQRHRKEAAGEAERDTMGKSEGEENRRFSEAGKRQRQERKKAE